MKTKQLLDEFEFHAPVPFARTLLMDQNNRSLRWMLKSGLRRAESMRPERTGGEIGREWFKKVSFT